MEKESLFFSLVEKVEQFLHLYHNELKCRIQLNLPWTHIASAMPVKVFKHPFCLHWGGFLNTFCPSASICFISEPTSYAAFALRVPEASLLCHIPKYQTSYLIDVFFAYPWALPLLQMLLLRSSLTKLSWRFSNSETKIYLLVVTRGMTIMKHKSNFTCLSKKKCLTAGKHNCINFVYLACKEAILVLPLPHSIASHRHHFYNFWHTKCNCSIKLVI